MSDAEDDDEDDDEADDEEDEAAKGEDMEESEEEDEEEDDLLSRASCDGATGAMAASRDAVAAWRRASRAADMAAERELGVYNNGATEFKLPCLGLRCSSGFRMYCVGVVGV